MVRRVLRGFLLRALGAISNFVFFIVVGRLLGAAETGLYMIAFGFVAVASSVCRLGLEQIVVREASPLIKENRECELNALYRYVILRVGFVGLSVSFATIALVYLADTLGFIAVSDIKYSLYWAALSVPMITIAYIHVPFLQAALKPEASVSILTLWIPIFSLGLLFLYCPTDNGDTSRIYFIACAFAALISIGLWTKSSPKYAPESAKSDRPIKLLKSSSSMLIGNFFLMSLPWIGVYATGYFSTVAEVGIFSMAMRVSISIPGFILPPIEAIVGPKIANLRSSENSSSIETFSTAISTALMVASILIFVILFFFGRDLLSLFGNEFRSAYWSLLVLCFGQLIVIICGPTRSILVTYGFERVIRDSMVVSALICLFLALLLVPSYGGLGAAVATSVSIAGQKMYEVYASLRLLGIQTYPSRKGLSALLDILGLH
ncbi:hypothetical protein CEW87_21300 [Parazoarcus communis]|uniref:Polysaccharide biosynthesis protein C-terminal domain-containing protein n=1 Tax=Parazoarcus communis TaxID=41977 RepID=A0A2U8H6J0_9RHOO|nr:oligosaccharide flippase family protein [Parazoarcus communis]AWI81669.1 hypothetical protein CEW87_21300 [Parazoarcus communis]